MAANKNGFLVPVVLLVVAFIISAMGCIPAVQQPDAPAASLSCIMVVSPDKLEFTIGQGQGPSLDQVLSVVGQGEGILNLSMSDNVGWINLLQVPGAATAQTTDASVNVDATGMASGQYTGIITITADGAANSPIYVPVYLTILPGANIPAQVVSVPPPSSVPPADSAVVWVNQTDFYKYATVSAMIVNGSVTNSDRWWYMSDVKIVANATGNSVKIAAVVPPGETIMYNRYIPNYQKDTVRLSYTWYKP
ncbi:MAG: hypothetical protein JW901_04550 [Dehalococcoidia bacterium]|nr:hypothetical protein [Dehalococcoidia bacterium]